MYATLKKVQMITTATVYILNCRSLFLDATFRVTKYHFQVCLKTFIQQVFIQKKFEENAKCALSQSSFLFTAQWAKEKCVPLAAEILLRHSANRNWQV